MSESENWPKSSNLFGSVYTDKSKEEVVALFMSNGWNARKCTWVDFEVVCEWAELVIDGENPILIHGPVVNVENNWLNIANIFKENKLSFSLECYDENEKLLHEERYKPT